MGAAFGSQRYAGRSADDDESGAAVEPVDERIQPTTHERVVDRSDRDEVLPVQLVAETERMKREEEVHLTEAELDVPSRWPLLPSQQAIRSEEVGLHLGMEHAELVDPSAEVGAHAHVGRQRDHPLRHVGHGAEAGEQAAEDLLRAHRPGTERTAHLGGHRQKWSRRADDVVHHSAGGRAPAALGRVGGETVPLGRLVEAELGPERFDLRR